MTLYSVLRFKLLFLFLAIGCSIAQAGDPLEKLAEYWIPNFDKETSADARQARFVGYLEGSLNLNIPQWWRNEGLIMGANVKPSENASIYGTHPKDTLEVNEDVFSVERDSPPSGQFKIHRKSKGKDVWNITEGNIEFGIGGSRAPRDFALQVAGDKVYVFVREGSIRLIVAYAVSSGSRLGYFAYHVDSIGDLKIR